MKKFFKRIGRAIKSGFKKFGKFMNKIGIVGQIAMFFILPAIGNALLSGLSQVAGTAAGTAAAGTAAAGTAAAGTAAGTAAAGTAAAGTAAAGTAAGTAAATAGTGLLGSTHAILRAAGSIVKGAEIFVRTAGGVFSSITKGISDFASWGLNKAGVNIVGAPTSLGLGEEGVFGRFGQNLSNAFEPITALRGKPIMGQGRTLADISKTTGMPIEELARANVGLTEGIKLENWGDIVVPEGTSLLTAPITPTAPTAPTTLTAPTPPPVVPENPYKGMYRGLDGRLPEDALTPPKRIDSLMSPEDIRADIQREAKNRVANSVTAPAVVEPPGTGQMIAQGAWDVTKERYALTGDDSPGLISAVTNINNDLLPLVYQEEPPPAQTIGGTPMLLEQVSVNDVMAHNTVMIPTLLEQRQGLQNQGSWGLYAHVDGQYRALMAANQALGLA
jgi:hypothetical protein